ncbi:hypothetical protein [Microvirga lenta]|uniref:hypothetical protein n=1 Tax=Microvirga lenta TaxID=2881337 RepID=UPI001CFF5563|nr:hypothetical protein [Microvirga lenta]MCB5177037.1 hypothetical protein [Microvirga lenta]
MKAARRKHALAFLVLGAAFAAGGQGAAGQPDGARSPFADADMKSGTQARCENLRDLTQGVETGAKRVDLSVVGRLTLVHFDGTLAYLGLCAAPNPQVLCVTYATNGLKVGDVVAVAGGYGRPDADHIVLDPCLASPPDRAVP